MNLARFSAVALALSLVFAPRAQAVVNTAPSSTSESTIANSAITVGLRAVGGAVLGASTLPFYEDSGAYVKNIYYGAAIGAVIGVMIASYSGVKDTNLDDDAHLAPTPLSRVSLNDLRLDPEKTSALKGPALFAEGGPKLWSPVFNAKF